MTPLDDDEKRAIVREYREPETAINNDAADVLEKFAAFQQCYRGELQAFIGGFHQATDKRQWVSYLGQRLHEEIEPNYWRPAN